MANVIDEGENGLVELAVLAVVVLAVLAILAWRKISIASLLYSVYSQIASFIDSIFYVSPIRGGNLQHTVDHGLGAVGVWLSDMMPAPTQAPAPDPNSPDSTFPVLVSTGSGGGQ